MKLSKKCKDLFTIITVYGIYCYNTLGQGVCSASDLFNIIVDGQIKLDVEWEIFKNMDDVLLWGTIIKD